MRRIVWGALVSVPGPKLVITPREIDLSRVDEVSANHWYCVRLANLGGGSSVLWSLEGVGEGITFNRTNGNLRAEQEIYFQVAAAAIPRGTFSREIRFSGASGGGDRLLIKGRR